jgi:hypothetical protein
MITIEANPYLLDFLYVAARMPQDERDQIESMTGHPFEIDGAAMGAFMVNGPKWVIKKDGRPISVFGGSLERPGVWRDFMMNTAETFAAENYVTVTRMCRKAMNHMFKTGQAHRVECIVPLARSHVFRWYKALGYKQEAVMQGYLANGYPAVLFSRVNG